MRNNEDFVSGIGGMKPWRDTSNPIEDTNILKQGIFICNSEKTENLPSGAYGYYVLISYCGLASRDWYYVYMLFGLNDPKRYTRLSIDGEWKEWVEF